MVERIEKCPYCKEGDIKIICTESIRKVASVKKGMSTASKSGSQYIILNVCPKCGTNKTKLRRALTGGVDKTHEERLKRLRDSGIPMIISTSKIKDKSKQDQF